MLSFTDYMRQQNMAAAERQHTDSNQKDYTPPAVARQKRPKQDNSQPVRAKYPTPV